MSLARALSREPGRDAGLGCCLPRRGEATPALIARPPRSRAGCLRRSPQCSAAFAPLRTGKAAPEPARRDSADCKIEAADGVIGPAQRVLLCSSELEWLSACSFDVGDARGRAHSSVPRPAGPKRRDRTGDRLSAGAGGGHGAGAGLPGSSSTAERACERSPTESRESLRLDTT